MARRSNSDLFCALADPARSDVDVPDEEDPEPDEDPVIKEGAFQGDIKSNPHEVATEFSAETATAAETTIDSQDRLSAPTKLSNWMTAPAIHSIFQILIFDLNGERIQTVEVHAQ